MTYTTRMLYADSRLGLSRQLDAYLHDLQEARPDNRSITLVTCTPIAPGRMSAEGQLANLPLGLLVVTKEETPTS